jgi:RNA polymerase sigma factor (sigma-70 family)
MLRWLSRQGALTPDQLLLERFVGAGDEDAFAALVGRYGPMVLGVCRRVLGDRHAAEDAFQATFLVLARKAASVRQGGTLAGWLHSVAYRVALRARHEARWRYLLERLPTPPPPAEPPAEAASRETLALLDEELRRLPEVYRLPIILCCLEGASQQEAADRLGWTAHSLKGRLERGRARLRARLARRGLALTGPGLLLVPPAEAAGETTPPALVASTLDLARGGHDSPAVAALARGVTAMLSLRSKCAALLVALALFFGYQLSARSHRPQPPEIENRKSKIENRHDEEPLPRGVMARLGTGRLRPFASELAISADGKTLVTAGPYAAGRGAGETFIADDGRTVRLWDTATGKLRATRRLPGPVSARATLSPRGDRVALLFLNLAEGGATLEVWDVASSKRLQRLPVPLAMFHVGCYFSLDGQTLARAEEGPGVRPGGTLIRLLDIASGKTRPFAELKERVRDMTFTADGKHLAAVTSSGTLVCWDRTTARELWSVSAAGYNARVAAAPDTKALLTWTQDLKSTRLRLWDKASGKEMAGVKLPGDERFREDEKRREKGDDLGSWLRTALVVPGSKQLVLLTSKQAVVWDLAAGKVLRTLSVPIRHAVLTPDGKSLVSLGRTLQRWDLAKGIAGYPDTAGLGHTGPVDLVAYAPDGKRLASASPTDETVRLWDTANGKPLHVFSVADPSALAFTPDGKYLLVGNGGGRMPLTRSVEEPGGRSRAVGTVTSAIRIFDTKTGKLIRKVGMWFQGVTTLSVSADGKTVSALGYLWGLDSRAGANKAMRTTLEIDTGKVVKRQKFEWQSEEVQGLAPVANLFSSDGLYLLTAQLSGLYLVDLAAGKRVELKPKDDNLRCSPLAFSPDNRLVVGLISGKKVQAGGFEGFEPVPPEELVIWERVTGKERARLKVGPLEPLAFAPDGRRLATSNPQGVRVWDMKTGKELLHHKPAGAFAFPKDQAADRPKLDPRFQAFSMPSPLSPSGRSLVRSLTFAPDGRSLAAGQADTTVLIWSAAEK